MIKRNEIYNISKLQPPVREAARLFGEKEILPYLKTCDSFSPEFPRKLYKKMAERGFIGFTTSKSWGGKAKTWIEYATLMEEISYFDASIGFILSIGNLALLPIELFGDADQKKRYILKMIQGGMIGAFALTEPQAGSDAANIQTKAEFKDNKFIINGKKLFISSGDVADIIILISQVKKNSEKGLGVLLVETEYIAGLTRKKLKDKMGLRGSTTARLHFKNSPVPAESLLGTIGDGFKIAMKSLDYSRVAIAAQAVGLAQACFDRSVDYAKKREVFGKPLSRVPAIQNMIADMSCRLEACRLMTYKAALLMDQNRPFTEASAQAKLYASESVNFIADKAVQIQGGYGYVGEFSDIEKLYRDARIIPIYEGTSEIQKMIIARNELK
ncbi:MAG: acyl-CoA dehydrogenase family protein [bacterium]